MSRDINPFGLRMPLPLRELLEESAERNGRSLNQEILHRLQSSFDPPTLIEADADLRLRLAILEVLVKDDNFAKALDDAAERVIRSGVDGSLPIAAVRRHDPVKDKTSRPAKGRRK